MEPCWPILAGQVATEGRLMCPSCVIYLPIKEQSGFGVSGAEGYCVCFKGICRWMNPQGAVRFHWEPPCNTLSPGHFRNQSPMKQQLMQDGGSGRCAFLSGAASITAAHRLQAAVSVMGTWMWWKTHQELLYFYLFLPTTCCSCSKRLSITKSLCRECDHAAIHGQVYHY